MDLPRSSFNKGSKIWYLDDKNNIHTLNNEWNPNHIITLREFSDNVVAMGSVANVHPHGLEIHLLNNMIGYVDYRNIFSKKFLENLGINDILTYWHKNKIQFPIGSHVVVKRLPNSDSSSGYLPLTLNPEIVNENLSDDLISTNMLLPTIFKSRESHGLLLEIPIGGSNSIWKGFIKFPTQKMKISHGNIIYAVVTEINAEAKFIKCDWPSAAQPIFRLIHSNANSLRPGTVVSTVVDLKKYKFDTVDFKIPFPAAIKAPLFENLIAILPATHLCKYSLKKKSFIMSKYINPNMEEEDSQSLVARIILIDYDTNKIYISLSPAILLWKSTSSETYTLKRSKKFKEVSILRTFNNYGFQILIHNYSDKPKWKQSLGFLHSTMGSNNDADSIVKTGVREVYYNYFEHWSVVCAPSVSKYKYMSPQHLRSGMLIRCIIEKIMPTGVLLRTSFKKTSSLKYSSPFSVWIHLSHLTDIPLTTIPSRFKVGKVVRARVIEFDFTRKLIVATGKKALVNDKHPLVNICNVKTGQKVVGFVFLLGDDVLNKIKKRLTIKFFSGIRAYLSQADQSNMFQEGLTIRNGALVTGLVTKVYQSRNFIEIKRDGSNCIEN